MKAKSKSKSYKAKPLKVKAKANKNKQAGELVDDTQPLVYQGPPPAFEILYKTNTGFDPEFHPQDLLIQLGKGHAPSEVAASWGISAATLNDWAQKYPELAEAKAVGATYYEAYWKRAVRLAAFGQLKGLRENCLFKILDNQVGFNSDMGGHEFSDVQGADLVFVDGQGEEF